VFEGWLAAGAIVGGGIAGGLISGSAAKSAANTQANAANNAQQISENEFNTITGQEQPFMQGGYGAEAALNQGLGIGSANSSAQAQGVGFGSLTAPFTAQNFQQLSPAYQFQQQQGMQGVLNQDSSGQGALSGATQKDLIGYNQNLANTSFNNAFNQYQTQNQNVYNRLSGIAQLGQNAASNTGQQGTALAGQAAQSATNVGTAQAAGTIGQANAAAGGLSSLSALPWLTANSGGGNSWNNGTPFASGSQLNQDPGAQIGYIQ
jgi:hypothetical protein